MNTISNKRPASSDPCSEFLNEFNQHRNATLTDLPNVVSQCFERLKELNLERKEKIRQHVCDLIITWGNASSKLEDPDLAERVHQTCIEMLFQLNTSRLSIECPCADGILRLTDVDYHALILSCPLLIPHAATLQVEILYTLLDFLKRKDVSIELLAKLYCHIEQFAPSKLQKDILKELQHAIESTRSLKSVLLSYLSYTNPAIRSLCASILGFALKASLNAYPFVLKENGYVSNILPNHVITDKTDPELFELVRGFDALRSRDIDILHNAMEGLTALNHKSVGLSLLFLHYYLLRNNLPSTIEPLTAIVKFKPEIVEYHEIRADVALLVNNIEVLKVESDYLFRKFPTNPKFISYRVLVNHLSGMDDDADMAALTQVILQHGTAIAYYIRSKIFYHAQNFGRALQDIGVFLKNQPGDFNGWFLCADIFFRLSDWDKAYEAFTHALNLNPENLWIHLRLAETSYHKGDVRSAIRDLKKLLKIDPDHLEGLLMLAAYSLPKDLFTAYQTLDKLKLLEVEDSRIDDLETHLDNLSHTASSA